MKQILIHIFLLVFPLISFAQVSESFGGRFIVTSQASPLPSSDMFRVTGIFKHPRANYTADSIQVGDIFVDCNCNYFTVDSIYSTVSNLADIRVMPADTTVNLIPSCTGGIIRINSPPNGTYTFPANVPLEIIDCFLNYNFQTLSGSGADGNGLFDAANDGDTIRATSAYFTELELTHTNNDGQFTLSDGQLNVLLESQEEIAGTRTMLLLDTLGISKLGLQTPSKESWVGFDYTIGDSLGLLVMIDSIYPDSGQILIAGADSLFRFGSLPSGADGNGIFDAANDGDTTAVSSVVLGQDFAVDMDGNDWLFDGLVEDDTTSRIMTLRGDGSLAYRWLDSLLNGYTTGSGTAGTLPIWMGANALGNSSLTESGGNVLATSFTGAFGLATGTTAQAPVGANGRIRYNTTENGISAWNGSAAAWQYLPWADADNWTAGSIVFSDGAKLTHDNSWLFFDNASNEFRVTNGNDWGDYRSQFIESFRFQSTINASNPGTVTMGSNPAMTVAASLSSNTALQIGQGDLNLSTTTTQLLHQAYSSTNVFGFIGENDGTGLYANIEETLVAKAVLDSISRAALYIGAKGSNNGIFPGRNLLLQLRMGSVTGNSSSDAHFKQDGIYMEYAHKRGELFSSYATAAKLGTYVVVSDSATYGAKYAIETIEGGSLKKSASFYGNKVYIGNSTTPTYTLDIATGGVRIASQSAAPTIAANVLYADSDDSDLVFSPDGTNWRYIPLSVTQTLENHGTISTSTDGSGDIVVAHGMGTTPTSVQVTVTGTTPYVVTVHTIGSTNFTVRFYDMTGAAVTSTAVTATWHCKT